MNITGVSVAAPTGSIQFTVTSLDGLYPSFRYRRDRRGTRKLDVHAHSRWL